MSPDEVEIADLTQRLTDALADEPFDTDVFYDEDGGEGYHVTIMAGEECALNGGGTSHEFVLAFWTRDETWYWERTGEDGDHTGPWPHRSLDGGSPVSEVVDVVRTEVAR